MSLSDSHRAFWAHLIKMTFSCRWLDEAFGPEPLYKVAITKVLAQHDHRVVREGERRSEGSRHAAWDGQDRAVTRPVA